MVLLGLPYGPKKTGKISIFIEDLSREKFSLFWDQSFSYTNITYGEIDYQQFSILPLHLYANIRLNFLRLPPPPQIFSQTTEISSETFLTSSFTAFATETFTLQSSLTGRGLVFSTAFAFLFVLLFCLCAHQPPVPLVAMNLTSQPAELIWAFLFHKCSNLPPPPSYDSCNRFSSI